jgi:hypothetical protein
LRPNPEQPWKGSGIEIIALLPPAPGTPVDQPPPKRQVFVMPRADGRGAEGLRLAASGDHAETAPEIRASAQPIPGGCEVAALLPWSLLGFGAMPAEFPFELVTDVVDPATGGIVQVQAFDLPSDGWRRLQGKLVVAEALA